MNEEHRSGYAALIGRPNAGKSTLLNQILGMKLTAVTPRPQTTRNRIFGIFDREDAQIVFQDTPGLLDPRDSLHQFMVRETDMALEDSDIVIWLIDSIKGVTDRESIIAEEKLVSLEIPLFVVFNKVDKVPLDQRAALEEPVHQLNFAKAPDCFYISALYGDGVNPLLEKIIEWIPPGPKFFPPDQLSDRTQRFFVSEIIREKAFMKLKQEVPYSLAVQVEEMKEQEEDLTRIQAVLYVERKTQKGILVGKGGQMIKQIGTEARKELEGFLGGKVYLELWVKVSESWRKKEDRLKEFGYYSQNSID